MQDTISTPQTPQVDLEPAGKRVAVAPNTTLLEAAQKAGVTLSSVCGYGSMWAMPGSRLWRQHLALPVEEEKGRRYWANRLIERRARKSR
jgi:hypothetical protein